MTLPRPCALLLSALVAIAAMMACAAKAEASPPGTLRSAAAGDGHLWWAVERVAPEVPGRSRAGSEPEYLLMHHASVEPAPTERFVMRLSAPPEAMAAEGNALVLVTPPKGERKRVVLLTRAQRNEAVGHWFNEPRTGPKVLAPLDERGRVLDLALVDGTLFVVRAIRLEEGVEQLEMASLATGTNAEWQPVPLPPLDRGLPPRAGAGVQPGLGWSLFRHGAALGAIGLAAGKPTIARLEAGEWRAETIPASAFAAIPADAIPVNQIPVNQIPVIEILGAFNLGDRTVLVERTQASEAIAPAARACLSVLRDGGASAWACFDPPSRPWCVANFGAEAVILELDGSGRGTVRALSPSSNAPREAITLMPPGFASGGWVHILIIGVASLSLALAALLFGSDEYLKARLGVAVPVIRPPGAPIHRRVLAFAIDCAPAFFLCWAVFGGSPVRLLEHPLASADLEASLPGMLVLVGGWLLATLGDAVFGRSLGKRLLGLMVLGRADRPASIGARLLRSVLSLVSVLSPPIMLLALLHPWGDGPAEMLTRTAVVDEAAWKALPRPSLGDGEPT